jgi:hypothetical protein
VHPHGEGPLYLGFLPGFLLQKNVAGNVEFCFLTLGGGVVLKPVFTTQNRLLHNRISFSTNDLREKSLEEYQGIRWRFVVLITEG